MTVKYTCVVNRKELSDWVLPPPLSAKNIHMFFSAWILTQCWRRQTMTLTVCRAPEFQAWWQVAPTRVLRHTPTCAAPFLEVTLTPIHQRKTSLHAEDLRENLNGFHTGRKTALRSHNEPSIKVMFSNADRLTSPKMSELQTKIQKMHPLIVTICEVKPRKCD